MGGGVRNAMRSIDDFVARTPRHTKNTHSSSSSRSYRQELLYSFISQDDVSVESENKVTIRRGFSYFNYGFYWYIDSTKCLSVLTFHLQFLNKRLRQY